MLTPYRINVFATCERTIGKGKRQRKQTVGCGYMGWTPEQYYREARLPGAGSFLFPGLIAVRAAAMAYLALPNVHQLAIKNNQDRTVYRYFKHADGRITGYGGSNA